MSSVGRYVRLLLFMLLLCPAAPLSAIEIRVAVASNFLGPLKQLAEQYEQLQGHRLLISSGSTGKLYAQIIQGAPYDLFLAANEREPARLQQAGLTSGAPTTYALGRLALWSQTEGLIASDTPQLLLASDRYRRLAMANPRTAPYGAAAMAVLEQLRLGGATRQRLVRAESVAQAYQYVHTGNAELGFVSLSQLLASGQLNDGAYWLVPDRLHPPIRQQAVVLRRSASAAVARDFLAYLASDEVRPKIEALGYALESQ